jgi:hypothetical protein
MIIASRERFSVFIFFPDDYHICEGEGLTAEEAVRLAKRCTERPAVQLGVIKRVIITDDGDNTVFEWTHGKGVTFK